MAVRSVFFALRLMACLSIALVAACNGKPATNHGNGGATSQSDAAMSPDATPPEPDASQCTSADCYQCEDLSEADCGPDTLCFASRGQRLDSTRNCYEMSFGGCTANLPCGGALTTALDTAGVCWMFPSTCLPAGFTYTDSQDPACGYAQFDTLEECPE